MKRWLLTLIASFFAAPVFAEPAYVGKWARSPALCQPEGDRVPMEIHEQKILFYESACDLKSISHHADSWAATLECSGEGETWTDDVRMTVSGDSLVFARGKNEGERYVRCH